jgi:uncharacterized protein YndB with AHSA1/START domain/DNA-binding transcriptional ArsR family regulator
MHAEPNETENYVEHEVRVAATPDTVFTYFTDSARMVQWMGTEATLDARPGGVCRINPSGHAAMLGEFVEVDPPSRIVFTWGWEAELFSTPPKSTLVEVSLTSAGAKTVVWLAHRRLKPGALAFHRAGWQHYLPRLARAASGENAGPDPWREFAVVPQSGARADHEAEALPDAATIESIADTMGAFTSGSRVRLLYALMDGERTVGQLAALAKVTPAATSHQLRLLRNLKLVAARREGQLVHYRLYDDHLAALLAEIRSRAEHALGISPPQ